MESRTTQRMKEYAFGKNLVTSKFMIRNIDKDRADGMEAAFEEFWKSAENIAETEFKKCGKVCDVKEDATFSKVYKDGEKYIYLRLSATSGQETLERLMFQLLVQYWYIIRMLGT